MVLNKSGGNMYPNTMTWNPLAGECSHKCTYCYINNMKFRPNIAAKYSGLPHIAQRAIKTKLGEDNTIFVQSMGDLFAENVDESCILAVLRHARSFPKNQYLFQTKNPKRFLDFARHLYPPNCIFGTTIETDRDIHELSKAPSPYSRYRWMVELKRHGYGPRMISMEPVIDFVAHHLQDWMKDIQPDYISIGADSQKNGLDEPCKETLTTFISLIDALGIEIRLKDNLGRLLE